MYFWGFYVGANIPLSMVRIWDTTTLKITMLTSRIYKPSDNFLGPPLALRLPVSLPQAVIWHMLIEL